ncbi:MAG: fibronectin type III domain-containing protein [Elusimicrobia bacterium]|nr:fibronectin type III domain-containing protein [Elusimicrobiota bacterium]
MKKFKIAAVLIAVPLALNAAQSVRPTSTTILLAEISTYSFTVSWRERNNGDVTYTLIAATSSSLSPIVLSSTFHDPVSVSTNFAQAVIAGLQLNTKYWVSVQAQKVGNTPSLWSAADNDWTLANAPLASTAEAVTSKKIVLSWDAQGNPPTTKYEVTYSSDNFVNHLKTAVGFGANYTLTQATVSSLSADTLYYLRVRARSGGGDDSGYSNVITTRTQLGPAPNQPTSTTIAAVGAASMTVTWKEKNNGLLDYIVSASTDSNDLAGSIEITSTVTDANSGTKKIAQAVLSPLTPNTRYWVSVRAIEPDSVISAFSAPDEAATLAETPIAAFTGVFISSLALNWASPAVDASGFKVQLSTDASMTPPVVSQNAGGAVTSAIISGLHGSTTYFVRVGAINPDNEISYSAVIATTTKPAPPPLPPLSETPTLTKAIAVTHASLTVAWKEKNGGDVSYLVVASTDPDDIAGSIVSSATHRDPLSNVDEITTTTVSGLSPNRAYWVSVQATRLGYRSSDFSSPNSTMTLAQAVSPVFSHVTSSAITAAWNIPPGGASGFVFELAGTFDFSSALSSSSRNAPVTALAIGNLSPNSVYFGRVASINTEGVFNWSSIITTQTPPAPFAPPAPAQRPELSAIVGITTGSAIVSWKEKNSGFIQYMLVAALDNNNIAGTIVATRLLTDAGSQINKVATATLSGLMPNTLYYLAVSASRGGLSFDNFSLPGQIVTLANPPDDLDALRQGPGSYLVRWSAAGNPSDTAYELSFSPDNFTAVVSTPVPFSAKFTGTKAVLSNLGTGLTYYVRVRAQNKEGKTGAFSETLGLFAQPPPSASSSTVKPGLAAIVVPVNDTRLDFGAGAMRNDAVIYVSTDPVNVPIEVNPVLIQDAVNRLEGKQLLAGLIREFLAVEQGNQRVERFGAPVTLEISYAAHDVDRDGIVDASVPAISVQELAIWRLDEAKGEFILCAGSRVDTGRRAVICSLEHFSVYAVLAQPRVLSAAQDVYAFPVPWRPNDADASNGTAAGITFANCPAQGNIAIYSLAGDLVRTIGLTGAAQIIWDGRNESGDFAASGVYLWRVEDGGSSKTGKLMVIR